MEIDEIDMLLLAAMPKKADGTATNENLEALLKWVEHVESMHTMIRLAKKGGAKIHLPKEPITIDNGWAKIKWSKGDRAEELLKSITSQKPTSEPPQ